MAFIRSEWIVLCLMLTLCGVHGARRLNQDPPTCLASALTSTVATFEGCTDQAAAGTCSGSCAAGYTGSAVATCAVDGAGNLSWNVTGCSPVCTDSPFSAASLAAWSCANTKYGSVCAGGCGTGYTGSASATCNADGSGWTVENNCVQACAAAPDAAVDNGAASPWASCTSWAHLDTCTSACAQYFEGGATATCVNGTWAVNGACNRAECVGAPTPTEDIHATFTCVTTAAGENCTATCNEGFRPSPTDAAPRALCLGQSRFDAIVGSCVPIVCSGPVEQQKASFNCDAVAYNEYCVGTCDAANGWVGTPKVKCTANGWSDITNPCKKNRCASSPSAPFGSNYAFNCGSSSPIGFVCTAKCNCPKAKGKLGFAKTSPTATCGVDGQWSVGESAAVCECV